jgi:glycosyltransferase involved in cell wall biosynthesis
MERVDRSTAVVIPAYQAERTAPAVLRETRETVPGAAIYLVDDGSVDRTREAAAAVRGVEVIRHEANRGKGAALANGTARALDDGARLIVTLDADGQHPPSYIPALLEPLTHGTADVTLGARERAAPMPPQRRCSNWLSALLASRIGGQPVSDAQTGFRAFTRAVALAIRPAETGYDYEAAFLLDALARGFRIRSVRVPTIYDGAESHFRHWRDTWRQVRVFARYGPRILFGPSR